MTTSSSKSAANRQTGKHQVDEQRSSILDSAEKLFLQNGIEAVRMIDIANAAGITKVTLYRYYANRDAIALEIQERMMRKVASVAWSDELGDSIEGWRERVRAMIRNFPQLRDAYRYNGMFDKVYLDHPPETALTQWTKKQLVARREEAFDNDEFSFPKINSLIVIMNNVVWFLEKLAMRGELTWSNQDIPLEQHLMVFEDMMMGYFDRLIEAERAINHRLRK